MRGTEELLFGFGWTVATSTLVAAGGSASSVGMDSKSKSKAWKGGDLDLASATDTWKSESSSSSLSFRFLSTCKELEFESSCCKLSSIRGKESPSQTESNVSKCSVYLEKLQNVSLIKTNTFFFLAN